MTIRKLDLYDLLAPQFMLGFSFPDFIDRYLRLLGIDEFQTAFNNDLILYEGTVVVNGSGEGAATFVHEEPAGTTISWNGNRFRFRLTVSRDAAPLIATSIGTPAPANGSTLAQITALFQALRPVGEAATSTVAHPAPDATVTDYPGFGFKLELLLDLFNFSLGSDWVPGQLDPVSHRLIPDTSPDVANERVKIIMPRAVLQFQQGSNLSQPPVFSVSSWGSVGLDSPNDLGVGELVRMDPPIALHRGGHFGFSVDELIIDTSQASTPPEILEHFGTSEDFTGLFVKQMLLYYSNDQGIGFNFRVNDALISFAGEVSLEGALDIYLNTSLTELSVESKLFEGPNRKQFQHGIIDAPASPPVVTSPATPASQVAVAPNAVIQLAISGGTPPYRVQVYRNGSNPNIWNDSTRQAILDTPGTNVPVLIYVEDAANHKFAEYLSITVRETVNQTLPGGNGTASDRPTDSRRNPATLSAPTGDVSPERTIQHSDAGQGTVETLHITGDRNAIITIRNGATTVLTRNLTATSRDVSVDLPHGATYEVQVVYDAITATSAPTQQRIIFHIDKPYFDQEVEAHQFDILNDADTSNDAEFSNSFHSVRAFFMDTTNRANISGVKVDGYASLNDPNTSHDPRLSENRRNLVVAMLQQLGYPAAQITGSAHGNHDLPDPGNPAGQNNRAVIMEITYRTDAARTITATLARPALPVLPIPVPTPQPPANPPAAPPHPTRMPDVLKRLGIRIRLERNALVLLELSGEIDFETQMEATLRQAGAGDDTNQLALSNGGGNTNPQDGVVDFKVIYSYNTATNEYGVNFVLGAHPDDKDGLLYMNNSNRTDRFKNIFGALLLFAPIINGSAVATANNSKEAGNWIALGASLAVPIAIGGLNVFRMRRAVLYGGELITKFTIPTVGQPKSSDVGLVVDYGVEFDIVVEALGIGLDRSGLNPTAPPMKVRYKAVGFNLHQDADGLQYVPVFDSSRGYDLDLSDPSIFRLPDPLGNLLGVSAARLARFNPLTLEVDMAIKFDLGVITVDKFKIKIPLDPPGPPTIMPSGVKVNIPGVIVGNGFVVINDTDVTQDNGAVVHVKGIEGGLDLTLVSLKIRAVGNIGLSMLKDTTTGREGIGLFLGLRVDFPSPLVLGSSGLGLYGLTGLFAMHYKRLEDPRTPGDPVGPALHWLIKAKGEPQNLFTAPPPQPQIRLWGPNFDRWSFGVGVILGTMDTGITANFQGMFILELPGPRILIMVKMKFISVRPASVKENSAQLNTGIIGIIDIDLGRQQITIGVMINFSIEKVLEIKIPVELFFKYDDPSDWHIWLGTNRVPASATILNMVRGSAYFMIQGKSFTYPTDIAHVPAGSPILGRTLNGVAIALGLEASLVFGSEDVGLYLKIGAGFHVGVSFTPFVLVGSMFFEGELRLFIVSIGAEGHLDVLITRKDGEDFYIYLHGQVCGHVSFFFFSISACIDITIESGTKHIEAPALLRGVYLQSNAPVLVSGQGGSKPIDASLGNALPGAVDVTDPKLWVPIDTIPVLQFQYSPDVAGVNTFTAPIGLSPDYRPGGWIELTKETRVKYILKAIRLTEASGTAYNAPDAVPATWRVERNSGESLQNGARTNVDLALFSRSPTTAERAVERSSELKKSLEVRWGNVCKPAADPAPVLFTFCNQLLGPAVHGWDLVGVPFPDAPDRVRLAPPDVAMHVEGIDTMNHTAWDYLMQEVGASYTTQAQVIGIDVAPAPADDIRMLTRATSGAQVNRARVDQPQRSCLDFSKLTAEDLKRFSSAVLIGSVENRADLPIPFTRTQPGMPTPIPVFSPALINRVVPAILGPTGNFRGILANGPVFFFIVIPICRAELTVVVDSPGGNVVVTAFDNRNNKLDSVSIPIDSSKAKVPVLAMLEIEDISLVQVEVTSGKAVITNLCVQVCPPGKASGNNCMRLLETPYCNRIANGYGEVVVKENETQKLDSLLKKYQAVAQPATDVILTTGLCDWLRGYMAYDPRQQSGLLVQELDAAGSVLVEHKFADLIVKTITSFTADLPPTWRDPAKPWRERLVPISQLLFSPRFDPYIKCLIELKPLEICTKVRFRLVCTDAMSRSALYIAAIERLSAAELQQQAEVTVIQQTDQATLSGYLNSNGPSPLLKPGTLYRLAVSYEATVETRKDDGTVDTTTVSPAEEVFSFRTDNQPPRELNPYVLTATPDLDEKYHFFNDPVQVVFNDNAVLKLYETYGKQLQSTIRRADGGVVSNSPDTISTLQQTTATVHSPYYEFVMDLIASGNFSCIGGAVSFHARYTTPFPLKPLMSYTFDIDSSPAETPPNPLPGQPAPARIPMYRRAFTTSRYADLVDFAKAIQALPVSQCALAGPVMGLPAAGPLADSPRTDVVTITDIDLQNVLVAAGYKPTPGREQTGITLFWVPRSGGGFRPHAVLIDAAEPTWRLRGEPKRKTIRDGLNNVIDPAFEVWEPGVSLAMELLEPAGSSLVRQYVRSTAGTRTLVVLRDDVSPASAGTPLSLDIRQTPSPLLGLAEKRSTLLTIRLDPKAPWED